MSRQIYGGIWVCILLMALWSCIPKPKAPFPDEEAFLIESPALDSAVRDRIGKPRGILRYRDVKDVTWITSGIQRGSVNSLEGMQYFTNLRGLTLTKAFELTDLSPLSHLTGGSVQGLEIINSKVSDLSPLANTSFFVIEIVNGLVVDPTSLCGIKRLEDLNLANNPVDRAKVIDLVNCMSPRELNIKGVDL